MTPCRDRAAACYVRAAPEVPHHPTASACRPSARVTSAHTSPGKAPLTCENIRFRAGSRCVSGRLFPQRSGAVHNLWTNLWTTATVRSRCDHATQADAEPDRPAPGTAATTRTTTGRAERDTRGQTDRSDLGTAWQRRGRGPPAQPARLAAGQRAGDPAREHRDHRGARRVHPQPARGPAARPARGRARPWRFGREIRIAVTVNPAARRPAPHRPTDAPDLDEPASRRRSTCRQVRYVDSPLDAESRPRRRPTPTPVARARRAPATALETRLNPKYTFETFVIGSSNRFPHAAAVAVAEAPGKAYNPLLVYGDSGLGKTHLLHAIGHYVRSLYTGAKVRYVSQRGVHQRVHQRDPRRPAGPVQAALPRRRRAADRRHPVPGGQDPDPGGVLPHLQHAPQRQQADRAHLRPGAQAARGARGPAAQPVRVGPDHRRPAARPRDPDRDPAQEGRHGPAHRAAGRAGVHRLEDPDQHPRARGCADPGHRLRQPQPPGGRHDPGRDRAQGPDPRGRRARDHRGADHRPDRGVLRAVRSRTSPARAAAGTW